MPIELLELALPLGRLSMLVSILLESMESLIASSAILTGPWASHRLNICPVQSRLNFLSPIVLPGSTVAHMTASLTSIRVVITAGALVAHFVGCNPVVDALVVAVRPLPSLKSI